MLASPGFFPLKQCCNNPEAQVQPGAAITDLRPRHHWHVAQVPGGRGRAARALGDILVDFAVLVFPRPEPFD